MRRLIALVLCFDLCLITPRQTTMDALRKVRDSADFKRTVREIKNKGAYCSLAALGAVVSLFVCLNLTL